LQVLHFGYFLNNSGVSQYSSKYKTLTYCQASLISDWCDKSHQSLISDAWR